MTEPISNRRAGAEQPTQPAQAALWTPRGRGAVAVIRLRIDVRQDAWADALPFHAANRKPLSEQPPGRVIFGRWGTEAFEDVVLCILDQQTLEIHCHGGDAAAARILEDCAQAGCSVAPWQEMVRVTQDRLEAELLDALVQATTLRTAAILLEQSGGLLRAELQAIQSECDLAVIARRIEALLSWADFGLHLTRPWKVVLAGRPNVGKSSLANALLGFTRSIVFDQPGTTRDVVTATTAIDGWPIEFSDTAGLRQASEPLETEGIQRARRALGEADLSILLFDASAALTQDDRDLWAAFPDALVVAHKCDLPSWDGLDAWNGGIARGWRPVSAKTGAGVEALIGAISSRLVPNVPAVGIPVPVSDRQVLLLQRARDAADGGDLVGCREVIAAMFE